MLTVVVTERLQWLGVVLVMMLASGEVVVVVKRQVIVTVEGVQEIEVVGMVVVVVVRDGGDAMLVGDCNSGMWLRDGGGWGDGGTSDMNIIYVLSGWEESAADSRILRDAITRTNGLKIPTVRRSWNQREEDALHNAMKEMVVKGERIENSFKSGDLRKVEGMLLVALPGTSIHASPHISSKLKV
ncbi:hypothetical protein RHSIM_Rhsim06G0087000 [Rhododendron simsii]|uniref:Uncharacterized protein n=1 Tax=Rhododendron simsii TaxID=118357 RepID=A0A834GT42_RHOSS|nr:hypothetical protein RHSIM_Rhsim06G0087000 [Rhododendron simsii]